MAIQVPPLRIRNEDIISLAQYACARAITQYGMRSKTLSEEALEALASYAWPGNVRELLHTVEAAVLAAGEQSLVLPQHLPVHLRAHAVRSRVDKHGSRTRPDALKTEPEKLVEGKGPEIKPGPQNTRLNTGGGGMSPRPPENQEETTPGFMPDSEQAGGITAPVTWREFQETALHEQRRRYLLALLQWAGGNVPAAARTAGLSRQRLYILLREHGIVRQWE